ncbi:hypothetical protein [Virgibacillus doumboii]|uniref:hypothetical protein n=1 Tax=Virgibacillus doumboii TaxID=2697503 RepID=UPI0013DF01C4|nr:hypothetical protein [Virgibacillus doumboii]
MNILLSLLLIVLIVLTTGTHIYFVWKGKNHKMLFVQLAIIGLTIILCVMTIYDIRDPSISKFLNALSPLQK